MSYCKEHFDFAQKKISRMRNNSGYMPWEMAQRQKEAEDQDTFFSDKQQKKLINKIDAKFKNIRYEDPGEIFRKFKVPHIKKLCMYKQPDLAAVILKSQVNIILLQLQ